MFENINKQKVNPLKQVFTILSIILAMMVIQLLIFCLLYWSVPNTWSSPLVRELLIYMQQSSSGWGEIYTLVIDEPLLVFEKLNTLTDDPLWSVIYYPWSSVLFLFVTFTAYFLVPYRVKTATTESEYKRSGLIFLLMLVLTQMQNIECCGSGPAWLLEVWFRTKVFAVNVNSAVDWTSIYNIYYKASDAVHVMLIIVVTGFLVRQVYYMKKRTSSVWI